ncbi:MAG: hypothetical protein GEV11_10635 [Streptosporangiales bacterium]|nr:hypothetical protein [Streptosporangiales bacterium]
MLATALTLLRPVRARHLLEPALADRKVDTEAVRATLRDHYSHPDGFCRHVRADDPAEVCSVYSIVMDLDARELAIAPHPACEFPYTTWRLDDLFARQDDAPRWVKEMPHV